MDTDTNCQHRPREMGQTRAQRLAGGKEAQACQYCTVRIVFVGLRVAKIDEDCSTDLRGDLPLQGGDNLATGLLPGLDDVVPVFRIAVSFQAQGVYQDTRHDGDLAALCGS